MAHVKRKLARTKQHEDDILCLLEREPKNEFHIFNMDYKTAWNEHKKFVLEEWIKDYPGTRPAAWWRYEAPEAKRKQLKGTKIVASQALDCESNYRHNKGIPNLEWYGENVGKKNIPIFESQAAYLKRHKLLTPAEKSILKKKDYDAVHVVQ